MERFERQTVDYQNSVISPDVPSLSIEAGSTYGWNKWAEVTIGIDSFGTSAPGEIALNKFGITPEKLVEAAGHLLGNGDNK